jgi:hypothetical protein
LHSGRGATEQICSRGKTTQSKIRHIEMKEEEKRAIYKVPIKSG